VIKSDVSLELTVIYGLSTVDKNFKQFLATRYSLLKDHA
jgi:hypothetical protein